MKNSAGGWVIIGKSDKNCFVAGKNHVENIDSETVFTAENCPEVLWSYSLEGESWEYISPSVQRVTGYSPGEAMALSLDQFFTPASYRYFANQVALRLVQFMNDESHPHVHSDEVEVNCKDGSTVFCEVTSSCIRSENGHLTLTGVTRRLKDRTLAEEELRACMEKHQEILGSIEEGYYESDLQGRLTFFNEAAARICGYTPQEFAEISYKDLSKDQEKIVQRFKQVYASGEPDNGFTIEVRCKDGSAVFLEISISPMRDSADQITGFRGIIRDITERVMFQKQLEYQSMHDQLTGLYNRTYFEEELRRLSKSREYPITMISGDVNGLKIINDTLGHDQGDRLLKAAAVVFRDSLRGSDVLARVGGDEFTAILLNADHKVAEKVMCRVKANVREYNQQNPDIHLSLSLGSATADSSETSFTELYKTADDRMYQDKFSPSTRARGKIVKNLLAALEKRDFVAEGHTKRLSLLCRKMGQRFKLSPRQLANLSLLAQVHDLGKVGIPDDILFKKGMLNDEEWQIMKGHVEKGYRIALSSNFLNGVAGLIFKHHEHWDGKGYPLGLRGREIPVECRILSIADAYDAMISQRQYKASKTKEEAIEELERCSGTQFDPDLTLEFIKLINS